MVEKNPQGCLTPKLQWLLGWPVSCLQSPPKAQCPSWVYLRITSIHSPIHLSHSTFGNEERTQESLIYVESYQTHDPGRCKTVIMTHL